MDLFSSLYPVEFCALASGSSGNCYYIGHSEGSLLVDIGISARKTERLLKEIGKDISMIQGVLLTHDHIDHIRAAEVFTRNYKIPLYATSGTFSGIQSNRLTSFADLAYFRHIKPGQTFNTSGFEIEAFSVSHDANDAVGFFIKNSYKKICIATDLGEINPIAASYLKAANVVVLESNYDDGMLAQGPYPQHLQKRIRGNKGHLSNEQTAVFLSNNWNQEFSHVFLAHLSEHNNNHEITFHTLHHHLTQNNIEYQDTVHIEILQRNRRSNLHLIDE